MGEAEGGDHGQDGTHGEPGQKRKKRKLVTDEVAGGGLTLEKLEKMQDCEVATVTIPEWGGDVHVRLLSVNDRHEIELWVDAQGITKDSSTAEQSRFGLRWTNRLVSLGLCTHDGKRLFQGKTPEEADEILGARAPKAVKLAYEAIRDRNGYEAMGDAEHAAEVKEDDEGNS